MQRIVTDRFDLGSLLGRERDGLAVLPSVLDALAEAVTIRAPDDSLIYANRAALARMGMSTLTELQAADPKALMGDYETTAADGEPLSMQDLPSVRLLRGEDGGSFGLGAAPAALGHLLESFVFCELEKSLPFLDRRFHRADYRVG